MTIGDTYHKFFTIRDVDESVLKRELFMYAAAGTTLKYRSSAEKEEEKGEEEITYTTLTLSDFGITDGTISGVAARKDGSLEGTLDKVELVATYKFDTKHNSDYVWMGGTSKGIRLANASPSGADPGQNLKLIYYVYYSSDKVVNTPVATITPADTGFDLVGVDLQFNFKFLFLSQSDGSTNLQLDITIRNLLGETYETTETVVGVDTDALQRTIRLFTNFADSSLTYKSVDGVTYGLMFTEITESKVQDHTPSATLSVKGVLPDVSDGEALVEALRDGTAGTVTLQKTGDGQMTVTTADDISKIDSYITYVIAEGTEFSLDGNKCIVAKEFTFFVTEDGITAYLPVSISYRNSVANDTDGRWTLTVNVSPNVSEKGLLGSITGILKTPAGVTTEITIDSIYAGELSSELVYYLDYSKIGKPESLVAGTTLTIKRGQMKDTLSLANDLVLLWDGSNWTDKANADDLPGDANGDSTVDPRDLVRYKNVLAQSGTFADEYVSDLNKDGVTNVFDTVVLRNVLVGKSLDNLTLDLDMDITSPSYGEVVYPYVDKVYDFLTTEGADINKYYIKGSNGKDGSLKDTVISWDSVSEYADKYVVEYSTKADYSDKISVVVDGAQTSVSVNNLYKAATYYVRAAGYAGNVKLGVTESTFETTDVGPRVMTIDGIYNVRDLGGYVTESGKTTVQGLIYRGSEMDGNHGISLTEEGDDTMSNLLGIKTDMDFRSPSDCNNVTESPISSATKTHYVINGYTDVFNSKYTETVRQIFATFADESNYPIYFHCWGGADRTGTIAYLLNGLLGVDEATLVLDYEMTSYSIFGVRADDSTDYDFSGFVAQLKANYEGDTLSEKIANYLLSIGVTETEIANIKAIMFGEETVPDDTESTENGILSLTNYWTTESGTYTLDSSNTVASSDKAVGYGKQVRIDLTTVTSGKNGDTYVMLGSYGVHLRGASLRMSTMADGGSPAEVSPRQEVTLATDTFDTEGGYLILGTEILSDTEIQLTVQAVHANGTVKVDYSYTFTRISNEIASEDAKVTIKITASEVSSLTVKTGTSN